MSTKIDDTPGVLQCPGLKITRNAGITWTDSSAEKKVHDLATCRMLTFDEVAADPLMRDLGFSTSTAVAELVRSTRLYPVFRKNARVIRIFACAIPDFRRRQLAPAPMRHLMQSRAEKVA